MLLVNLDVLLQLKRVSVDNYDNISLLSDQGKKWDELDIV